MKFDIISPKFSEVRRKNKEGGQKAAGITTNYLDLKSFQSMVSHSGFEGSG